MRSQDGLKEDELCLDYSSFNSELLLLDQMFDDSTTIDSLSSLTDTSHSS